MTEQDTNEIDYVDGVIEKKGYRQRWIRYVKKIKSHPFNHGVHMDTHHLISAEAIKIFGEGDLLINKGYNINVMQNLVGFPATLPGACHLGVQLHRGNHIAKMQPREESYHDYIARKMSPEIEDIKNCYGKTKKTETDVDVHKLLDPISNSALTKINNFKLPLTELFLNFKDGGSGCKNCFNVKDAQNVTMPCSNDNKHFGVDARYQNSNVKGNKKTITFNASKNWQPSIINA